MATKSFDEMMVIDTPEAARNFEAAFYDAEVRGPLNFGVSSVVDQLTAWVEFRDGNPKWYEREVAKVKERLRKEREEYSDPTEE